jgi:transposase
MWLLFHRNAKTKPVRGGDSFVDTCPECGNRATFVEVEITESVGVFFVDLLDDTERAYRCCACGETFDLKDKAPASAPPPARPIKSAAELELESVRAELKRREAARAKAVRIEDELAELKKRMGR